MELSQIQEALNEIWDEWNTFGSKAGEAEVNESLIVPVKNALIFQFVPRKSISLKDLETALNTIWKPSSSAIISAVGEGIFVAAFENMGDCNKIIAK